MFGSLKWNRIYIGAQASPLRPEDIFRGHLMFMTMRIAMNSALVTVLSVAFGAARSRLGGPGLPGRGADRDSPSPPPSRPGRSR